MRKDFRLPSAEIAKIEEEFTAGNYTNLGKLYSNYRQLFLYVYKHENQVEIEDVIQDVFVNLMKLRNFDKTKGSLLAYIKLSIRRRVLDLRQNKKRARRHVDNYARKAPAYVEEIFSDTNIVDLVREAIEVADLSPEQEEVLVLHYARGLPCRGIGVSQNMSINAVKGRMWSARQFIARENPELAETCGIV